MPSDSPSETLRQALNAARRILLTGPVDPDGDSLGACLALARGLRQLVDAEVVVAGTPSFRYAWMPGASNMTPDAEISGPFDLAIVLDGDQRRLVPAVAAAYQAAGQRAIIDHHVSTDPSGYDHVLLDPGAASTCEMVVALLRDWGLGLDRDLAALLYTGLIFDTGGFRHSNTRPESHRLAAQLLETGIDHAAIAVRVLSERRPGGLRLIGVVLSSVQFFADGAVVLGRLSEAELATAGATSADVEGLVELLVFTTGVEVACLAIERGPTRVKLSLRSRSRVDVSALARVLAPGGGGHPRAAGAMLDETLEAALARLPAALAAAVG